MLRIKFPYCAVSPIIVCVGLELCVVACQPQAARCGVLLAASNLFFFFVFIFLSATGHSILNATGSAPPPQTLNAVVSERSDRPSCEFCDRLLHLQKWGVQPGYEPHFLEDDVHYFILFLANF